LIYFRDSFKYSLVCIRALLCRKLLDNIVPKEKIKEIYLIFQEKCIQEKRMIVFFLNFRFKGEFSLTFLKKRDKNITEHKKKKGKLS
jgi:hypothetical protein